MPRQTKLSIVPDSSMSGVESSAFYQTPNKMAIKAIQAKLTSADWCVWSYLQMIDPFGDRQNLGIDTSQIAEEIGISRRSVQRALKTLHKAGLLPDWFEVETYENPEYQVVQRLQAKLGGQTEIVTAVGRIDLLTETEIIEVKQVSDWKAALGQILTYARFFPEHIKRIHLFGNCTPEKKQVISSTVLSFGVIATFEEVKDEN